jgi:hypothetical protein
MTAARRNNDRRLHLFEGTADNCRKQWAGGCSERFAL